MIEVEGGCLCGEVRFRTTIDEKRIGICHCRDCQILGGSAYRVTATADQDEFEFLQGEPSIYVKTSDRGTKRHLAFCPTCGTQVAALPDPASDLQTVSVRVSTCKEFAKLKPAGEVFCRSRVNWLEPIEGLVQFETMPQS